MLQQQHQLQDQLSQQHQEQQQQQGIGEGNNNLEDIRRLRETIAQRRGRDGRPLRVSAASRSTDTMSESDLEARKELIHQNLFVRQIDREESVIELLRLLAISRGGDGSVLENEDEELGRINWHATSARESTSNPAIKVWEENNGEEGSTSLFNAEMNEPLPPAVVSPSAPPLSSTVEDTTTSIATPKTMTAVGRLWRSFSRRQQSDPNIIAVDSTQQHQAPQQQHASYNNNDNISIRTTDNSSPHHSNRTECSICLEQYSPNDTIAWAKDGGDTPPTSSSGTTSTSYYTGCDHIFHKECLVAWLLQGHDECPLCRRRVIHADANVRFAGWDER